MPTTTDMKYRAKAAVDTLFVRFGDGLAAVTAFVGMQLFSLPLRGLFAVNAVIVVLWLALGFLLVREHRVWAARRRRRRV